MKTSARTLRPGDRIQVGLCDAEIVRVSPVAGLTSLAYRYLNGHCKGQMGYEQVDDADSVCLLHKGTDESWTMHKPANGAPLSRSQRADLGLARQLAFEVADAMVRYNDGRLEHILPAETIERIESYEIVRKNIRG